MNDDVFWNILVHTKSILNSQIRAVVLLGSNQIPSTMTIVDEHLIQINFIPYEPGFYFINIYNGNQSIEGFNMIKLNENYILSIFRISIFNTY